MMLEQTQEHGYDNLLLRLQVLVEIGLVCWSDNEEIKHETLQCRKGYNINNKMFRDVFNSNFSNLLGAELSQICILKSGCSTV